MAEARLLLLFIFTRALAAGDTHQEMAMGPQSEPLLVDGSNFCFPVELTKLEVHRDLEHPGLLLPRNSGALNSVLHCSAVPETEARGEGSKGGELRIAGLNGQGIRLVGDSIGCSRSAEDVVEIHDLCCVRLIWHIFNCKCYL